MVRQKMSQSYPRTEGFSASPVHEQVVALAFAAAEADDLEDRRGTVC